MNPITIILLGIFYSLIFGLFAYVITIKIIPEKFKDKFFSIVPFFPKLPYSLILYLISGILYLVVVYFFEITEQILKILIIVLSVIISSLFVKLIAKLRKDNMEESYEEELKRKRNS